MVGRMRRHADQSARSSQMSRMLLEYELDIVLAFEYTVQHTDHDPCTYLLVNIVDLNSIPCAGANMP